MSGTCKGGISTEEPQDIGGAAYVEGVGCQTAGKIEGIGNM